MIGLAVALFIPMVVLLLGGLAIYDYFKGRDPGS